MGSGYPSQESVRSEHVTDTRSPVLEDGLAFHFGVIILRCVGSLRERWGRVGAVGRVQSEGRRGGTLALCPTDHGPGRMIFAPQSSVSSQGRPTFTQDRLNSSMSSCGVSCGFR